MKKLETRLTRLEAALPAAGVEPPKMSNRELATLIMDTLTEGAADKQVWEDAQARADRGECSFMEALPPGVSIHKLMRTIFQARQMAMMCVEHGISSDKGKSPLAAELAKHIPQSTKE